MEALLLKCPCGLRYSPSRRATLLPPFSLQDNHSGDDTATNLPGDTEEYPDHCFHEAGKFGRLLLKGNWTAIGMGGALLV